MIQVADYNVCMNVDVLVHPVRLGSTVIFVRKNQYSEGLNAMSEKDCLLMANSENHVCIGQ